MIDSGQVREFIEERAIVQSEGFSAVQTIKAPIYDGAGKINGVQISFWDITDRQRMAAAQAKLEAQNRSWRRLRVWPAWPRRLPTTSTTSFRR